MAGLSSFDGKTEQITFQLNVDLLLFLYFKDNHYAVLLLETEVLAYKRNVK